MKPAYNSSLDKSYGFYGSQGKNEIDINILTLSEKQYYLEFTPVDPIYDSEGHDISNSYLNNGFYLNFFSFNSHDVLLNELPAQIYLHPWTFTPIKFCLVDDGGVIERGTFRLIIKIGGLSDTSKPLPLIKMYEDDGAIVSMSNIINNLPSDLRTGLSGLDSEMLNRTVPVGDLKTLYTECNNSDRYSVLDVYGNRIWQNNREIRYADCKFPITKPVYFAMEGLEGGKGDKYNINNGEYSYSGGFANQLNIIAAQQKAEPVCTEKTSDSSSSDATGSSSSSNSSTTVSTSTYAGLPSTPPMICTFNVLNTNWINTPHNDHEWSTTDTSVQSKYNPHEFKSINDKGVPVQITIQKSISSSETAKEPTIELYSMTYSASSSPKVKIGAKRSTVTYSTKYLYNNYSSAAGQSISVYNFIFNFKATSNTYIKIVGGGNEIVHVEPENNVSEEEKLLFEFIRDKCFTVAPGDSSRGIKPRKVSFLDFNGYVDKNDNFTVVDNEELLNKRKSKYYSEWKRDDNNNFIDPVYGKKIIDPSTNEDIYYMPVKSSEDDSLSITPYKRTRILSQSEWYYMIHRKDDKGYLVMNINPMIGDDRLYNHFLDKISQSTIKTCGEALVGSLLGTALLWYIGVLGDTFSMPIGGGTSIGTIHSFGKTDYLIVTSLGNNRYGAIEVAVAQNILGIIMAFMVVIIVAVTICITRAKDEKETLLITYILPDNFETQLDRLLKLTNNKIATSTYIERLKTSYRPSNNLVGCNFAPYDVTPILEAIGAKAILPIGYYEASNNWQVNHGYALAGVGGYGHDISKIRSVNYNGPEDTNSIGNVPAWTKYRNRKYPIYPVYDYCVAGISDYGLDYQDYSGLYILYNTHHDNGKDSSDMRIITQWCGWGQTYDPTDFPYNGSYHANLLDSSFNNSTLGKIMSSEPTQSTGFLLVDYTYNTVMKGMFKSSNVRWLEFPPQLKRLVFEDYIFDGCQYLSHIILNPVETNTPSNHQGSKYSGRIYISQNAFANTKSPITIYFNGTQTQWNNQYRSYNNDNTTLPVNVSRIVCIK